MDIAGVNSFWEGRPNLAPSLDRKQKNIYNNILCFATFGRGVTMQSEKFGFPLKLSKRTFRGGAETAVQGWPQRCGIAGAGGAAAG